MRITVPYPFPFNLNLGNVSWSRVFVASNCTMEIEVLPALAKDVAGKTSPTTPGEQQALLDNATAIAKAAVDSMRKQPTVTKL